MMTLIWVIWEILTESSILETWILAMISIQIMIFQESCFTFSAFLSTGSIKTFSLKDQNENRDSSLNFELEDYDTSVDRSLGVDQSFGKLNFWYKLINIDLTFNGAHLAPSFTLLTLFPRERLLASERSVSQSIGPVNVYKSILLLTQERSQVLMILILMVFHSTNQLIVFPMTPFSSLVEIEI